MSEILNVLLKSKWFWIAIGVLFIAGSVYGIGKYQTSKYEKQAADLKESNEKLKQDAKVQEDQFTKRLNSMSKQAFEINKKLTTLAKENQALAKEKQVLIQQNQALAKKSAELEAKYAELQQKIANISVPAGRKERVELFKRLGY